jgi:adenosylcobinamide-phosphate synthase
VTLLVLAVALDLLVGDPPNRWHPVAWIGRLVALGRARAPRAPDDLVRYGAFLILIVAGLAAGGALVAHALLGELPGPAAPLAQAWLLKCSFSLSGLLGAVEIIRGHLVAGDLAGARRQVAWHLVSRDTTRLDGGAVASAAVESLAENLTDGVVAPLCFYAVGAVAGGGAGGLALAWAYRAVNTADAMIGYRRDELEYLGRATARTDDVASYVPARLAAVALVAGAWLARESAAGAGRALRRDGRRTESPNAGLTMATMAGALGVTLEKRGLYRLGEGPPPDPAAIDRAMRVARRTGALWVVVVALALALMGSP